MYVKSQSHRANVHASAERRAPSSAQKYYGLLYLSSARA